MLPHNCVIDTREGQAAIDARYSSPFPDRLIEKLASPL